MRMACVYGCAAPAVVGTTSLAARLKVQGSVRENVWGKSKKRKKSCFFGFWKKRKKRWKRTCRPTQPV